MREAAEVLTDEHEAAMKLAEEVDTIAEAHAVQEAEARVEAESFTWMEMTAREEA